MSKKAPNAINARRDVLTSPLLRKGSAHIKSRKVQRRDSKASLRKQWCPQNTFVCVLRAALGARTARHGVL